MSFHYSLKWCGRAYPRILVNLDSYRLIMVQRKGFMMWFMVMLLRIRVSTGFLPALKPTVRTRSQSAASSCTVARRLSSPDDADHTVDYSREETLLKIRLSVQEGVDSGEALDKVAKYAQSFPFAAVLPVQPLMYIPNDEHGVDVKFMRKKTDSKSGIDGGIRFTVVLDDEDGAFMELAAKRNSQGQSITKIMAEKLVITAFVAGITGEDDDKYGLLLGEFVSVSSIYHKWM